MSEQGPNPGVGMVCYCAADLIWATRIKSTADSLGIPCRPVRNVEMLEARLGDSDVRAIIVDLEAGAVVFELIRKLAGRPVRVLAFGPHVAAEQFAAARAAGAHIVLARGAFDARLPEVLRELSGEPAR